MARDRAGILPANARAPGGHPTDKGSASLRGATRWGYAGSKLGGWPKATSILPPPAIQAVKRRTKSNVSRRSGCLSGIDLLDQIEQRGRHHHQVAGRLDFPKDQRGARKLGGHGKRRGTEAGERIGGLVDAKQGIQPGQYRTALETLPDVLVVVAVQADPASIGAIRRAVQDPAACVEQRAQVAFPGSSGSSQPLRRCRRRGRSPASRRRGGGWSPPVRASRCPAVPPRRDAEPRRAYA